MRVPVHGLGTKLEPFHAKAPLCHRLLRRTASNSERRGLGDRSLGRCDRRRRSFMFIILKARLFAGVPRRRNCISSAEEEGS